VDVGLLRSLALILSWAPRVRLIDQVETLGTERPVPRLRTREQPLGRD
jgi:hypothetical protein